jgi:signal transduction histidine kinase
MRRWYLVLVIAQSCLLFTALSSDSTLRGDRLISMPGWTQFLVIAACVTCGVLALFERRRARIFQRQIQQLTQVSNGPLEPASQPRKIPHQGHQEALRRLKHDVKNPLTSILCFCALLRQSAGLTSRQADYVSKIQHSANGIVLLLESVEVSGPESGTRDEESTTAIERSGAVSSSVRCFNGKPVDS